MGTVPQNKRVSPGELLKAQMIAREQRLIERRLKHKQALEWAQERSSLTLDPTDPAYWYVITHIRNDALNGYRIHEPWCFEGRMKIHLTKWYEITNAESAYVVYYIKVGRYIKIGTTRDVDKRLRQYPPGAKLLVTEPGHFRREAQRHEQFADYLAERNEWFRPAPELMEHIKNLQRHAAQEIRRARAKAGS